MKLKKLLRSMTKDEAIRLARLARTSPDHLRFQIGGGFARPSFKLAVRIVRASRKMYPDDPQRWLSLTEWFPELPTYSTEAQA
jgi:hypothetical protein